MSDTFCPAKWAEIYVNTDNNWVMGCCKSTPVNFTLGQDISNVLHDQRNNLLSGIQDPGCKYCWDLENAGHQSLRHIMIEKYKTYKISNTPSFLSIKLGNVCNFMCSYCTPKFSSKWNNELSKKPFSLLKESNYRVHYQPADTVKYNLESYIEFINNNMPSKVLSIAGGEPLMNKEVEHIIDQLRLPKTMKLSLTTNMCPPNHRILDKILKLSETISKVFITVSLDSGPEISEFVRYGCNYEQLLQNLHKVLSYPNVKTTIHTVFSNITIFGCQEIADLVISIRKQYGHDRTMWNMSYIINPQMQSFSALPPALKTQALSLIIKTIGTLGLSKEDIELLTIIKSKCETSEFSETLYNHAIKFYNEFIYRTNPKYTPDIVAQFLTANVV